MPRNGARYATIKRTDPSVAFITENGAVRRVVPRIDANKTTVGGVRNLKRRYGFPPPLTAISCRACGGSALSLRNFPSLCNLFQLIFAVKAGGFLPAAHIILFVPIHLVFGPWRFRRCWCIVEPAALWYKTGLFAFSRRICRRMVNLVAFVLDSPCRSTYTLPVSSYYNSVFGSECVRFGRERNPATAAIKEAASRADNEAGLYGSKASFRRT